MAMTAEQQRAASERILAKEPLTDEEMAVFEMLTKRPEQYIRPGSKRVCGLCGAEFRDRVDAKGNVIASMLEQFSDHQSEHNPGAEQWGTAHERIQAGKERAKSQDM